MLASVMPSNKLWPEIYDKLTWKGKTPKAILTEWSRASPTRREFVSIAYVPRLESVFKNEHCLAVELTFCHPLDASKSATRLCEPMTPNPFLTKIEAEHNAALAAIYHLQDESRDSYLSRALNSPVPSSTDPSPLPHTTDESSTAGTPKSSVATTGRSINLPREVLAKLQSQKLPTTLDEFRAKYSSLSTSPIEDLFGDGRLLKVVLREEEKDGPMLGLGSAVRYVCFRELYASDNADATPSPSATTEPSSISAGTPVVSGEEGSQEAADVLVPPFSTNGANHDFTEVFANWIRVGFARDYESQLNAVTKGKAPAESIASAIKGNAITPEIPAWTYLLPTMKVGQTALFYVHYSLAWGENGVVPFIAPKQNLFLLVQIPARRLYEAQARLLRIGTETPQFKCALN